jgi:hypothetical protein
VFKLFATEEAGKESRLLWLVFVTLATLTLRDTLQGLLDVLTATCPGCFVALATGYLLAHG